MKTDSLPEVVFNRLEPDEIDDAVIFAMLDMRPRSWFRRICCATIGRPPDVKLAGGFDRKTTMTKTKKLIPIGDSALCGSRLRVLHLRFRV